MINQKVLFGLHVPKCAGTSILNTAKNILDESQVYQSTAFIENYKNNKNEFYEITNKDNLRFVFGHHLYDEMIKWFDDVYLFTFIRSPEERCLSEYAYLKRLRAKLSLPPLSVSDYLANRTSMCDFIISRFPGFVSNSGGTKSDKAISILSKFDYVGDIASLPGFSNVFSRILGIDSVKFIKENVAQRNEIDNREREILLNSPDSDDKILFEQFKRCSLSDDNPFFDVSGVDWRKDIFSVGEYEYKNFEEKIAANLVKEYSDYGVLQDFVALAHQKISFLNTVMVKAQVPRGISAKIWYHLWNSSPSEIVKRVKYKCINSSFRSGGTRPENQHHMSKPDER